MFIVFPHFFPGFGDTFDLTEAGDGWSEGEISGVSEKAEQEKEVLKKATRAQKQRAQKLLWINATRS